MTGQRCRECGKPLFGKHNDGDTYNPKGEYSQGLHKKCYEKRRRTEMDVGRIWEKRYEETYGAFEDDEQCYWCSNNPEKGGVDPKLKANGVREPIAWFMDEPICKKHLVIAHRWARHLVAKHNLIRTAKH